MVRVDLEVTDLQTWLGSVMGKHCRQLALFREGDQLGIRLWGVDAGPVSNMDVNIFVRVADVAPNAILLRIEVSPGGMLGKAAGLGAKFGFGANAWAEPFMRQLAEQIHGVDVVDAQHVTIQSDLLSNRGAMGPVEFRSAVIQGQGPWAEIQLDSRDTHICVRVLERFADS